MTNTQQERDDLRALMVRVSGGAAQDWIDASEEVIDEFVTAHKQINSPLG